MPANVPGAGIFMQKNTRKSFYLNVKENSYAENCTIKERNYTGI